MMRYKLSTADRRFRAAFEAGKVAPEHFDHRAHIRLAYCYLAKHCDEEAYTLFRHNLQGFLQHQGVDASKYHETMTKAWILAVRHFMEKSSPASSSEGLISQNRALLDYTIMMTHYSEELLFSTEAWQQFLEPDLAPSRGIRHEISHF